MINVVSSAKKVTGMLIAWSGAQDKATASALNKGVMWVRNDAIIAMRNTPRGFDTPQTAAFQGDVDGPKSLKKSKASKGKLLSVKGFINRRGGKLHIPSRVGYAPAIDTGRLVGSIRLDYAKPSRNPIAMVFTRVEYAKPLEYGRRGRELLTRRPFFRPALMKNQVRIWRQVLHERNGGTGLVPQVGPQ